VPEPSAVIWAKLEVAGHVWPIRVQRCCGGLWTALAFDRGRVVGVGAGGSRTEAVDIVSSRLPVVP
jgi:hypothetical protein